MKQRRWSRAVTKRLRRGRAALCVLCACAAFLLPAGAGNAQEPAPRPGVLLARDLVALAPAAAADLFSLSALLPAEAAKADAMKTVAVYSSRGVVVLPFSCRYAGRMRLTMTALVGGGFADFQAELNGAPIADTRREQSADGQDGPCRIVRLTAITEPVPAEGNLITLRTPGLATVGLLTLEWTPAEAEPIPLQAWRRVSAQRDAAEAAAPGEVQQRTMAELAQTLQQNEAVRCFFFHPDPQRVLLLRVGARAGWAMTLNGVSCLLQPAEEGMSETLLAAPQLRPGWNELQLVCLYGGRLPGAWFSSASDTPFFAELPPWLRPSGDSEYPRLALHSGDLQAVVMLPDGERGYYRGNRFEAAGMVVSLRSAGREYFGALREEHDPLQDADASGTGEEFREPLGYEGEAVGARFVKIGVGVFRKPLWIKYNFGLPTWQERRFPWTVEQRADAVLFAQQAQEGEWGYRLSKRVSVSAGALRTEYEFTNTGRRRIRTSHYAHNFLLRSAAIERPSQDGLAQTTAVRRGVIRPELVLRYSSPIRPQFDQYDSGALRFSGSEVRIGAYDRLAFVRLSSDNGALPESVFYGVDGEAGGLRLENRGLPMVQHCLFVGERAVCPEFFVRIDLAPGETARWSRSWAVTAVQ